MNEEHQRLQGLTAVSKKECLDVVQPQVNKGMNKLGRDKKRENEFAVEQKMKRSDRRLCESAFHAETMARIIGPTESYSGDSRH
jgi:hypothetical protein